MEKQKIQHWTSERVNGSGWTKNQMYYGARNSERKTVHVDDGTKLCSIEVRSGYPTEKLKQLFLTFFNVQVRGKLIHQTGRFR